MQTETCAENSPLCKTRSFVLLTYTLSGSACQEQDGTIQNARIVSGTTSSAKGTIQLTQFEVGHREPRLFTRLHWPRLPLLADREFSILVQNRQQSSAPCGKRG